MKPLYIVLMLLLSFPVAAQSAVEGADDDDRFTPSDFTFSYLFAQSGQTDMEEMEDSIRRLLTTYVFQTPDEEINALGALLSVGERRGLRAPQGLLAEAYQTFLMGQSAEAFHLLKAGLDKQLYWGESPVDTACVTAQPLLAGLFGIQPDEAHKCCIIRPGLPDWWDEASVHTPLLDYQFRRMGSNTFYFEVTQHARRPQQLVLRLNLGMGEYRDIVGTKQRHQVFRIKAPQRLPDVAWVDAFEPADSIPFVGFVEPTFERKFRVIPIETAFNDSVGYTMNPDFLMDKEYVVEGVPFRIPLQGQNVSFLTQGDTLTVPLTGKAERAWLLLTGTSGRWQPYESKAFVKVYYENGTMDYLPLVNPDNWSAIAPKSARRLCLRLNPDKKLTALEICPLTADVKIGLMGVTLQ